ncbi:MAG: ATP-grasp domain-containing protein [Ginsengibacter sp.]
MRREEFSVLIPDGESDHSINVLRCLGQMDSVSVFVLSSDPRKAVRYSRYCNKFISYQDENCVSTINAIYETVEKIKPDVVLPVDVHTIPLLSDDKVLPKLTSLVPLPSVESFKIANNKWLLAQWLKVNDIPGPPTVLFKPNDPDFEENLSSFDFPVLLKPSGGFGGEGIEFFAEAKDLNDYCKKHDFSREFILQTFIDGYDVDCSIFCMNGKIRAYTIQKEFISGANFRRAAAIDFFYDSNTYNLVSEVVKKLHWSGIAHIDLRYDIADNRVKLIEINPRYWGSLMGSFCSGVNFPYLTCLAALKQKLPQSEGRPLRYIQGKTAIKSIAKKLLGNKKSDSETSLQFILKDPLPTIVNHFRPVK